MLTETKDKDIYDIYKNCDLYSPPVSGIDLNERRIRRRDLKNIVVTD